MPKKPRNVRVVPRSRKAWAEKLKPIKRLRGHALMERNARIKARDCYTCQNRQCGKRTLDLHVDHIIPLSQGGSEEDDNLQTLCVDCNMEKAKFERLGKAVDNPHSFKPKMPCFKG